MVWDIDSQRVNVTKVSAIQTKNGPIAHALQDKSGLHYVLAHCNSETERRANISIWELDEKKHTLKKVAQNVPG